MSNVTFDIYYEDPYTLIIASSEDGNQYLISEDGMHVEREIQVGLKFLPCHEAPSPLQTRADEEKNIHGHTHKTGELSVSAKETIGRKVTSLACL